MHCNGCSNDIINIFPFCARLTISAHIFVFSFGRAQLDLYGDVDEQRSKATIEPGVVMVKIPKQQAGTWPQLKAAGPAEEIKARREAALEIKRARDEKAVSDTKEKKRQDDDYVFHKQWDLEKDEKRTIERLAELHKREAEASLHTWSDALEGRSNDDAQGSDKLSLSAVKIDAKQVTTYFDKQLVEGELDPFQPTADGVVPLPGTYHKKTARTIAMEKSLAAEPDEAFDIREKEGDETDKRAILEKEKEKERENARKAREEAAAKERETDLKRAEDHKKEEQDRIMPLPLRERHPKDSNQQEQEQDLNGIASEVGPRPKNPSDSPVCKDKDNSDSEEGGGEEISREEPKEPEKVDIVKDEEKFLGRKKGASVNRWESEKIADQHRTVADAYYKVGLTYIYTIIYIHILTYM